LCFHTSSFPQKEGEEDFYFIFPDKVKKKVSDSVSLSLSSKTSGGEKKLLLSSSSLFFQNNNKRNLHT